jgi:membrane-bound metal-dependent hydrolase YbcI (DUF457 family)
MHVVTHLLSGWLAAEALQRGRRERAVAAWCAVAPDLDGVGMIVDWYNRAAGRAETDYYEQLHHVWGHGLPAALVFTIAAWLLSGRRAGAALLAFAMVHLHLLLDLLGSRGSNPLDLWPIAYLAPFSSHLMLVWPWQWPLTGWQNTSFSCVLLAMVFVSAVVHGRSPVELLSTRMEAAFVAAVGERWRRLRRG